MGNGLAYLMLAIWPAVCVAFFARLSLERALIWSIIGAYMLLPPITEFDLPLVPDMDKFSIPNVAVLLIIVAFLGLRPSFIPRHGITKLLVAAILLGTVITVLTNSDPIKFLVRSDALPIEFSYGQLPGLRVLDTLSVLSSQIIMLIPFFLARAYLSTDKGLRELMFAILLAGLIYTIPALIEIRLSPQINTWVYGFFQHNFLQMMREGGFRPIVFMPHALWLALFFVMALSAGAALVRAAEPKHRWRYLLATFYLVVVLYLSKSQASQLYALLLLPLILFGSATWQIRVAVVCALIAVIYPMLRGLGLVPLDLILAKAQALDPARAQSLEYRFWNEEQLLARAAEKPAFGWGGWGRNLERDPHTGEIATIPDGRWIIVFGTFGWMGYIAQMGLVALPIALVAWYKRKLPTVQMSPLIAPLCLMLGITMMDMLLNDTLVPMTWLLVGAILGYAERFAPERPGKKRPFPEGPAINRRHKPDRRTVL